MSAAFLPLLPGSSSAHQRLSTIFARCLSLLLLIFAIVLPALAGPFEDAVGKFANDDFSDTEDAVGAIATVGQSAGLLRSSARCRTAA